MQDINEYKLNINEAMMFAIQAATGHASHTIIGYFYDIVVKQRSLIENSEHEVKAKKRRYRIYNTKQYGFYPNTQVYFVAATSMHQHDAVGPIWNHGGMNSWLSNASNRPPSKIVWECTVNPPRNMITLDNNKLREVIAESLLISGGELDVSSPHSGAKRQKFSVENLFGTEEPSTDPINEGQEG